MDLYGAFLCFPGVLLVFHCFLAVFPCFFCGFLLVNLVLLVAFHSPQVQLRVETTPVDLETFQRAVNDRGWGFSTSFSFLENGLEEDFFFF